jgi:hypothetical protein
MTEQRNLMTELMRNVNNLVTRIEQLDQRPPPHRDDDEYADDFGDEDADADGYARRRLCNRTDQIIRAQVQKQAPKRSNFRT